MKELKVYGIKDKVMGVFTTMCIARNNTEAVRKAMMAIGGQKPYRDCEIYEVATCDEDNGTIKGYEEKDFKKVNWNEYNLPMTKEEDLEVFKKPSDLNK